jgi:uncharacterized protein (TIGR00297 family)
MNLIGLLLGVIVTLAAAVLAMRREALSKGGTIAAILFGFIAFFFGGWVWLLLLVVFFVSSSFLTKFKEKTKKEIAREFAKAGARDFWQVTANGTLAAFFAALNFIQPSPLFFAAFLGVIATVTADTWATELGILWKKQPRMITGGKKVPVGTSGAVSLHGSASAFAGSLLIAATAFVLLYLTNSVPHKTILFAIAAFAGFVGSMADSFFGATIQGIYYCKKCRKETERRIHKCGSQTVFKRGFAWLDNDVINLLASMVGAVVAVALYALLG